MKPGMGWRWLRVGELIQRGDEFFDIDPAKQWRSVGDSIGKTVPIREVFRRRITRLRKPVDVDALLRKHGAATHAGAKANFYR